MKPFYWFSFSQRNCFYFPCSKLTNEKYAKQCVLELNKKILELIVRLFEMKIRDKFQSEFSKHSLQKHAKTRAQK